MSSPRGDKGMAPGTRRAFVALALLALALAAASVLISVNYYVREAGAQMRQGRQLEARLCTSLDKLAALKPPPGSPGDNPARGFEQAQHDVLAELGPDVGCGEAR